VEADVTNGDLAAIAVTFTLLIALFTIDHFIRKRHH
jgi:hypothetical protein